MAARHRAHLGCPQGVHAAATNSLAPSSTTPAATPAATLAATPALTGRQGDTAPILIGSGDGAGLGNGGGGGGGGFPSPGPTDTPPPSPPLEITTASLPVGIVGQPYSVRLTAQGGVPPYRNWKATGLPKGITLNGSTLTGTPTEAAVASVTVTDNAGGSAYKELTLPVILILRGDLNGDDQVDCLDEKIMVDNLGKADPNPAAADINRNGKVDVQDMAILLTEFGKTKTGAPPKPVDSSQCPSTT